MTLSEQESIAPPGVWTAEGFLQQAADYCIDAWQRSIQDYLGDYGGLFLIGMGIAAVAGAAVRLVRTSLRIDDHTVHSAEILSLAPALLRRRRADDDGHISTNANRTFTPEQNRILPRSSGSTGSYVGGNDKLITGANI